MNLFFKKAEYGFKYQHTIFELLTSHHAELQSHQVFDMDTDPFVEDCFVLIQLIWGICTTQLSNDLRKIKNKKIMIINHGYSFTNKEGLQSLQQLTDWLNSAGFESENVYILCQFPSEVDMIHQYLPNSKVHAIDEWLVEFLDSSDIHRRRNDHHQENTISKKFSIFSRRYTKDRFDFFTELVARNLLDECYFTFTNNYGCNLLENISTDELKTNIPENLSHYQHKIKSWIDGMPYVTDDAILDPNPGTVNNMLTGSKINIVYETNPIKSPSMISEKTYKAMFFKKPFIVVCHVHTLKLLKECGYKTFSPWIDESYDEIEDYQERKLAILNEIERLNSLSDIELDNVISQCNDVLDHNYNQMIKHFDESLMWPKDFMLSNI